MAGLNNAYAQSAWQPLYNSAELLLPAFQVVTIDITTPYDQNRITCHKLTGIEPVIYEYDNNGNEIMAIHCDDGPTVLFGAGVHAFKAHDYVDTFASVSVLIESYSPLPTPTAVIMPTSAPTSPVGGNGVQCGLTPSNPCYTIPATPQSGGGGGGYTSETAITIGNLPPTPTMIPVLSTAIAQTANDLPVSPVTGVYSGTTPLMPAYVAENNDNYTASIIGETWYFGCPFNTNARGISAKLCINYQYISAIRIIGIDIPLGIIIQAMLVLVVVYIIKKR